MMNSRAESNKRERERIFTSSASSLFFSFFCQSEFPEETSCWKFESGTLDRHEGGGAPGQSDGGARVGGFDQGEHTCRFLLFPVYRSKTVNRSIFFSVHKMNQNLGQTNREKKDE